MLGETPDVAVIATGGMPDVQILREGNELAVSAWDIISGDVRPGANVLVFDEAGDHAGLQASEFITNSGGKVEIMTADRTFAPEVMGMNLVPYMRSLQKKDVIFTVAYRLEAIRRDNNRLMAQIGSDYGGISFEREFDQIVVNDGTRPMDDLYFDLKPLSRNMGAVDYDALIDRRPQKLVRNPESAFELYRIGDAVSARNTHAAIYDGLRLGKVL